MHHLLSQRCITVGIDEAGRGPLAGPVVAGACRDRTFPLDRIKDSKKLSAEEREHAFRWIERHCVFGFGVVSAEEIDAIGILEATQKAMQGAVSEVAKVITPTYLLIDGRDQFWFDYPHSSIIDGDQKEPCISAASIVAKVTRDRLMIEYAKEFPKYHFEQHKGYGTQEHFEALQKFGPCSLHRKTFLKNMQFIPVPGHQGSL